MGGAATHRFGLPSHIGPFPLDAALIDGADTSAPVIWSNDTPYDFNNYHDMTDNTTKRRLVAPANGIYRTTANLEHTTGLQSVQIDPHGPATGAGYPYVRFSGAGTRGGCLTSSPVPMSATDYVDVTGGGGAGTIGRNWFGIERLDDALQYALCRRTTGFALSANAEHFVDFNTDVADVGSWHDAGTSDTKFIVPAGVSRVRLIGCSGSVSLNNDAMRATFVKNVGRSTYRGMPIFTSEMNSVGQPFGCNPASAVLEVTPGDYFEFRLTNWGTGTGTIAATRLWAAIEEIPSWEQCCLVYRTSDQSCTGGADTTIPWQQSLYDDTGGIWSAGDPTKIIAPPGASYARIGFGAYSGSNIEYIGGRILHNGSEGAGLPDTHIQSDASGGVPDRPCGANALGFWRACAPGDEFTLSINPSATFNFGTSDANWLCGEFR